jgi:hypothetical protein
MTDLDPKKVELLAGEVAKLNPAPRAKRWGSLTACVVDAVWSINADYDAVVVPKTRALLTELAPGVNPLLPAADLTTPDPAPLTTFLDRFPDDASLAAVMNRQVTSTRTKKRKADAARQYARILIDQDVPDRLSALALLHDPSRFAVVDTQLRRVHGEGSSGIRRNYFWMLVGDDDGVKPDRMLMRWFKGQGIDGSPEEIREWVRAIAAQLVADGSEGVTAWSVDHAIWDHVRRRRG